MQARIGMDGAADEELERDGSENEGEGGEEGEGRSQKRTG